MSALEVPTVWDGKGRKANIRKVTNIREQWNGGGGEMEAVEGQGHDQHRRASMSQDEEAGEGQGKEQHRRASKCRDKSGRDGKECKGQKGASEIDSDD